MERRRLVVAVFVVGIAITTCKYFFEITLILTIVHKISAT